MAGKDEKMPEVGAKMPSQITNDNAVNSKFCAILKKKVIAHGHCQEFSSLYRRTLKQMKQKWSSGNVVHLFVGLSVLLHQVLKKQRRTLRLMEKKWRCGGRYYRQTKTP